MKTAFKTPTLREMRIALDVLATLEADVPNEIMLELSGKIREREEKRLSRRLNRMSEEELIRYSAKTRTTLRVITDDGRLIQAKTNDITFVNALRLVGKDRLLCYSARKGRKPIIVHDPTENHNRHKQYLLVGDGVLVHGRLTAAEKKRVLDQLDERYELGWTITVN